MQIPDYHARFRVLCLEYLHGLISYIVPDQTEHSNEDHRPEHSCQKSAKGISPPRATGDVEVADEIDPETLAVTLLEHVEQTVGEDEADAQITRVVAELFGIRPEVCERIVEKLMTDLKEEIARREDPRYSRATIALVQTIEEEWRNRS
jgi:hypothetical protein